VQCFSPRKKLEAPLSVAELLPFHQARRLLTDESPSEAHLFCIVLAFFVLE
jgi:hypothetical protein